MKTQIVTAEILKIIRSYLINMTNKSIYSETMLNVVGLNLKLQGRNQYVYFNVLSLSSPSSPPVTEFQREVYLDL